MRSPQNSADPKQRLQRARPRPGARPGPPARRGSRRPPQEPASSSANTQPAARRRATSGSDTVDHGIRGYRGRCAATSAPCTTSSRSPPSEVHAAAFQYVRKVSGTAAPSQAERGGVRGGGGRGRTRARSTCSMRWSTSAPPKNREVEATKARARAAAATPERCNCPVCVRIRRGRRRLATVSAWRATCAIPTCTATRSSWSRRTTCGPRRSVAGRAYRLTADDVPVSRPRLSPDGSLVAWTSTREWAPEVFVTAVDGGAARRLTWWGDHSTRAIGWTSDGDVLAVSAAGRPSRRQPWAYAVPADGGTPRRLPLGPLADLAQRGGAPTVLLSAMMSREMAWQKRYRGGTAGKLWWNPDGEFVRLAADLDGNLDAPMLVGDRIAFLSDHEGWGNLYSLAADGTGLRRHTDHGADGAPAFYVRHAATDGGRVVYESAGQLWILDDLDAAAAPARRPPRRATRRARAVPDRDGGVAGRVPAGHDRPVQRRHRPRHRAPPHPSRRPGPRPARPPRRPRAAGGSARRRPRGVGRRRARRGRRLRRPARSRAPPTRPPSSASAQASSAGCWSWSPRPTARASPSPRTTGGCSLLDPASREPSASWPAAATARSTTSRISPDSAWLAYCDPLGSGRSQVVIVRLADGEAVPVTEGRFRRRRPGVHPRRQAPRVPLPAQLRPDLRPALRST